MAIIRKKTLDGIDRDILRCLNNQDRMVNRQIAKCVGRTPSAISPRLNNLHRQGMIKPVQTQGMRNYSRTFGNKIVKIKSPRSISWVLDLKKK